MIELVKIHFINEIHYDIFFSCSKKLNFSFESIIKNFKRYCFDVIFFLSALCSFLALDTIDIVVY